MGINKRNAASLIQAAQDYVIEAEYQADGFDFDGMLQGVNSLSPVLITKGDEEDLESEREELVETLAVVKGMAGQIEEMAETIRGMQRLLEQASAALGEE